jgi:putative ABC transport system permease protein
MKLYDAIAAGIAHFFQNWLRTGLSILGILIGVASVLCMMAIGDGAKLIIAKDLEKLGGANQVKFRTLKGVWRGRHLIRPTTERYTLEDAYAIEAECPHVLFAFPKIDRYQASITSQYARQTRLSIEGVTANYAQGMHWDVQHGRFFKENDIDNADQVCVLGSEVATDLFGNTSPIGQEVKIRIYSRQSPVRCRVIGIMASKGKSLRINYSLDNIICVPLTMFQQRLSGNHHVQSIIVFFQKEADVYKVIDSVKRVLRKRHRGTDNFISYWIPKRSIRRLEHIEKVIKIALGGIAGFSLLVSGIGIMNICLVSVGEKTREIGLRKSVGARRIDIFYQFLTESTCLCLCGGVLGIASGWLAAHGMAQLAVYIMPIVDVWPVVLSVRWMGISVLFSIFMGIVFGVYPAIRASRMAPIDALRTET